MSIEVDFRERQVIEELQKGSKEIITAVSLQLGDFLIKTDRGVEFVIERKTMADLSASIKDGRFAEQKSRLLESVNANQVLYIIEGNWVGGLLPEKTLESAILNLMIRHNFKVIRTKDHVHTADVLNSIMKKVMQPDFKEKVVIDPLKLVSKKQKRQDELFENQLCMISGVSKSVAKKICDKYENIIQLSREYEESDDKENLLADIHITEKRKIGKALSKRICSALYSGKQ